MPTYNPNDFSPTSGKEINSSGNVVTPADGINSDGSQNVVIVNRKQTTIQTHNNVSVAATTSNTYNGWIDCNGYDKVAFTIKNDAATTNAISIYWSNDGINIQGNETNVVASSTNQYGAGITDVKARYVQPRVYNGDTVSHALSAWAFLKA